MTSDVVLTSALRNNLLSLQNTQSLIDKTQFNLSTGRSVNSALDSPQNFFAAQSLGNRASDLTRLLDGIGQSIRVIEQANNGVTALTSLIEQADSIASQASDALSSAQNSASATGTAASATGLTGITDLTTLAGISSGDQFTVQVGDSAREVITITSDTGVSGLIADLNDIANIEASLDSNGQLTIRTTNGETLRLANETGTALTASTGLGFTQVDATLPTTNIQGVVADSTLATAGSVTGNSDEITSAGFLIGAITGVTTGDTFTIEVNGTANNITISAGLTATLFIGQLSAITGVSGAITSSDIQLYVTSDDNVDINDANGDGAEQAIFGTAITDVNDGIEFHTSGVYGASTSLTALSGVDSGDNFTITVDGTTTTIAISEGLTATAFATQLSAITGVSARVNASDIQIYANTGANIDITDPDGDGAESAILGSAVANITTGVELDPESVGTTFTVGSVLTATLTNNNAVASATDTLNDLDDFSIGTTTGDSLDITVTRDGTADATVAIALDNGFDGGDTTIQDIVDEINSNEDLAGLTAAYNEDTGEFTITADSTVDSFTIDSSDLDAGENLGFGFGNGGLDFAGGSTGALEFSPSSGAADSTLAQLQADFNELRGQIDDLVGDASYSGVNLLNGDDLVTNFNEDATSSLTTSGVTFTAQGLGITTASFSDAATISTTATQVDDALTTVRNFGTTLANDLAVIQTRQDFTSQAINTLEAGADDLTIADQNAEGARLLALQTRQQLGVTSLALASQSQQSVLRLF